MTKNKDFKTEDLENMDLTSQYQDLEVYNTISWKDYTLLYLVLGIFLSFIIWANLARVDEVARGIGKVIPSSEVKLVQNLEGGIIDKIFVQEGDIVEKGQALVQLNNVRANADYQLSLKKLTSLKVKHIRLQAEADNQNLTIPEDMQREYKNAVDLERAIYNANKAQFSDQEKILNQQVTQKEQEIVEIQSATSGATKLLSISKEELAMIEPLLEKGSVSKYEMLQLQSKLTQQETTLANLKSSLERSKAVLIEAKSKVSEHRSNFKVKIQKDIVETVNEINSLEETILAYQDREKRTLVKSPVYGTVKEVKLTTVGGVVQPGEDIMEIVPLDDQLIVEANISPADIAFVHKNQKAMIKITAYDYSVYGGLNAQVQEISADTIENDQGESFYRVKLKSDVPELLTKNNEKLPIMSGMIASADILTGQKTVMDYLLKPFKKTLQNALHER